MTKIAASGRLGQVRVARSLLGGRLPEPVTQGQRATNAATRCADAAGDELGQHLAHGTHLGLHRLDLTRQILHRRQHRPLGR
ncbi:hypothetical protein [Sphingobium sp. AntQ-1]|uniref:hypothetical protein n=1 Tax=Sphingobium sp. AntQ-1 TaxID=2930091 RepID=UPI00234ED110|nr:hypothetical protein [Sphingobium sp. AntQ-1]